MKISKVTIKNCKSIRSLTINFQDLIVLVGENNAGKSNILSALELFFRSTVKGINEEWFFKKDLKNAIEVIISFNQLNEWEKKKFEKYVIGGTLTLKRQCSWDIETDKPELSKYYGMRIEPKEDYLKESKIKELKDLDRIVEEKSLPDYFKSEKGTVTIKNYAVALKRFLSEHRNKIKWEEPKFEEKAVLGFKEVVEGNLPDFIIVPAVKDVTDESKVVTTTVFGKLINAMLSKIIEQNERIKDIDNRLHEVRKMLNRPLDDSEDRRLEEIKVFEKNLSDLLEEHMPTSKVELEIATPEISTIFQLGTKIVIDNGLRTYVESKGHGLQRSMIFTLFRAYAEFLKKISLGGEDNLIAKKSLIIAVEDPELYLHPQLQRRMYEVLKRISAEDQILICTHSTFFINMGDYKSIGIVRKDNIEEGTKIRQYICEIFSLEDEKSRFKMLNEFDPERNELFFARKVILVEGDTEKVVLPLIARKLGTFDYNLTTIECNGKYNLPLYIKVLNKFKIPYLAVYDTDSNYAQFPEGSDEYKDKKKAFEFNKQIEEEIDINIGQRAEIDPDFETIAEISESQAEKKGRPFAAFQAFYEKGAKDLPEKLSDSVRKIY